MTEAEKARVAAQKVKERLKRRRREAAFERALNKNLKVETEIGSEALYRYRFDNSMLSKALELDAKRNKPGVYVV